MSILIDEAIKYIEAKDAHYLAKEGLVVYFTSATERKSDQVWVKHSMTETIRIIRATRLNIDQELREHHVLSAFQELDRVYEYGVKSRFDVVDGIFNYNKHSNLSLVNQAALALADAFVIRGLQAMLAQDVWHVYDYILNRKLADGTGMTHQRETLLGVFANAGYEHKVGSRRILYNGTKMNAFMMPNTKPSQVVVLTNEINNQIIQQVYGGLK